MTETPVLFRRALLLIRQKPSTSTQPAGTYREWILVGRCAKATFAIHCRPDEIRWALPDQISPTMRQPILDKFAEELESAVTLPSFVEIHDLTPVDRSDPTQAGLEVSRFWDRFLEEEGLADATEMDERAGLSPKR